MRIAALLCLIAATVLAGCSSNRGQTVRTQPRAAVAYGSSSNAATMPSQPVERVNTVHERVVTSYDAPPPPALPSGDTFVPASRPAPSKAYTANETVVSAPSMDPCDPCARPAPRCCPPRIPNPFCRPKCCPPGG